MRAQGLWNSREEGKWVAVEVTKMHREQGIRCVSWVPPGCILYTLTVHERTWPEANPDPAPRSTTPNSNLNPHPPPTSKLNADPDPDSDSDPDPNPDPNPDPHPALASAHQAQT